MNDVSNAAHFEPELRVIDIDLLQLSQTGQQGERRKHFDKQGLHELADSLKSHGQLQPIICRPKAGGLGGARYEIIAGERRYLAAQLAGLDALQVTVREFTDQQVIEVQILENLQREGLHELAEAEGYGALRRQHGYSIEDLVAKVGKSRSYVFGRLKLLALGAKAREAFYDKKIEASIALLLARIPVEELQDKALEHILKPNSWHDRPLSYRDALEYIHEEFTLRLSEAPFPRDDADLVPLAGACGTCPKRTGNQPELFGDIKGADVCTDPSCFKQKRAAWNHIQVVRAKETGQPVITGAEARKVQPRYSSHLAGYVRPADKCESDPKRRTYAQLVGKAEVPSALLQNPDSGKFSKVYKIADLAEVLKKQNIKVSAAPAPADTARRDDAERRKRDAERAFRLALLRAVLQASPAKLGRPELELLAGELAQMGSCDPDNLLELMGWDEGGKGSFESRCAKLTDAELPKLIIGLLLFDEADSTYAAPRRLLDAAKRLKVDPAKVRAAAESATVAAAEGAKTKSATKPRAKK